MSLRRAVRNNPDIVGDLFLVGVVGGIGYVLLRSFSPNSNNIGQQIGQQVGNAVGQAITGVGQQVNSATQQIGNALPPGLPGNNNPQGTAYTTTNPYGSPGEVPQDSSIIKKIARFGNFVQAMTQWKCNQASGLFGLGIFKGDPNDWTAFRGFMISQTLPDPGPVAPPEFYNFNISAQC